MNDNGGPVLGFSHYLGISGMSLPLKGQYIELQISVSFRQVKLPLLQSELVRRNIPFFAIRKSVRLFLILNSSRTKKSSFKAPADKPVSKRHLSLTCQAPDQNLNLKSHSLPNNEWFDQSFV
jgi:hypothetical protein